MGTKARSASVGWRVAPSMRTDTREDVLGFAGVLYLVAFLWCELSAGVSNSVWCELCAGVSNSVCHLCGVGYVPVGVWDVIFVV